MDGITRREFLQGKFTSDPVVEYGTEFVVGAALVVRSLTAGVEKVVSYTPESERLLRDTPDYETFSQNLDEMTQNAYQAWASFSHAYDLWKEAYEKTYTTIRTEVSCDKKGICTTRLIPETHVVWEEPKELTEIGINHKLLANLRDYFGGLAVVNRQFNDQNPTAFDFEECGNKIYLIKHEVDLRQQRDIATLAYAGIGVVYATYEEIVKRMLGDDDFGISFADTAVKRRSLLKAMTGVGAIYLIDKLQGFFSKNNQDLYQNLNGKIVELARILDISPLEQLKVAYGGQYIPQNVISVPNQYSPKFGSLPQVANQEVNTALANCSLQMANLARVYAGLFGERGQNIPSFMGYGIANIWATQELLKYTSEQDTLLQTNHLQTVLAVAGMLGCSALITEFMAIPASKKIMGQE